MRAKTGDCFDNIVSYCCRVNGFQVFMVEYLALYAKKIVSDVFRTDVIELCTIIIDRLE